MHFSINKINQYKIWTNSWRIAKKNFPHFKIGFKGMTEGEMVGWHHWLNGLTLSKLWGWWQMGKPGMLQSMGSQRVGHNWATDQQHFLILSRDCFRSILTSHWICKPLSDILQTLASALSGQGFRTDSFTAIITSHRSVPSTLWGLYVHL